MPADHHRRIDLLLPLTALGIALAGAIGACVCSEGAALGLAIAGLAFAGVVVPPLAVAARDMLNAIAIGCACVLGSAVVWIAVLPGTIGWSALAAAILVLGSCVLALVGAARFLLSVRFNSALAGASITLLAFAWLSWPVWLSHRLGNPALAHALVAMHPVFAINGTSPGMGAWTQQRLMYRLTALGQDVPYSLPANVWPCVLTHAAIASAGLIGSYLLDQRARLRREAASVEPSDR